MAQSTPRTSTSLAFLAVLVSTPFAMCQDSDLGTLSVSGGMDPGIWDIPGPIFRDLVSHPNATGSIDFSIANGQYSLQLNVTADVPLTDATDPIVEDVKDDYTTTSILSLLADSEESLSNTTICYYVWSGLQANISAASKGRSSQDGAGCDDILSEQCVSDLMSAGSQFGSSCQPGPAWPQSCTDQSAPTAGGISSSFEYNSSDPVFYMQATSPTSDKGNETAWSSVSTNIWPVLLAFQPNGTDELDVQLNCIRPDTFSEGSVNPNDEPASGSSTGGTSTGSPTSQPTSSTSSPSSGATAINRFSVTASLGLVLAVAFGFL